MKILDISHHQKGIDLYGAKMAGYEGVIIRLSYGRKLDECFYGFYEDAVNAGLLTGAYLYSRAVTEDAALKEAYFAIEQIEANIPSLPLGLFYDMEELHSAKAKHLLVKFHTIVANAGIRCGLYCSMSYFNDYIKELSLAYCPLWIARYSNKMPSIGQEIWGWQYTSSADPNDFYTGPLDRSIVFSADTEYPAAPGTAAGAASLSLDKVALAVMQGDFGDGKERKDNIFEAVQVRVNAYYKAALRTLNGEFGNGDTRVAAYKRLGLDPDIAQAFVNIMVQGHG